MNAPLRHGAGDSEAIIKLAILAVGGQGGGVVTSWIVSLAESAGYYVQATSVPGVAQRTGATIYYIEMVPETGRTPILSLMPAAGDVDIVLAAELMEAGRAIERGFVTPGRTTLIASSHRALAVAEKMVPGSGIFDPEPIRVAAHEASLRFLSADLERLAVANGSVISASLFGALAGAKVLPFPAEAFEATIRRSGKGVAASLAAFRAGYAAVEGEETAAPAAPGGAPAGSAHARLPPGRQPEPAAPPGAITGSPRERERYDTLLARIERLPEPCRPLARRGLAKVVDFQDARYGEEYLGRVEAVIAHAPADADLAQAAAKAIANALAYDDVIRVADLKTRRERFERVGAEAGVREGEVLTITEYMHPRAQEIVGLFPARLGARVERSARLYGVLERVFCKGRRVRTDTLRGFLPLYLIGALRPVRRRLLRHKVETAHVEEWLAKVHRIAPQDPALAAEVLRCRRLIKGYSDTHVRGQNKFDKVLSALPLLEGRADGADWLRRLREAALLDEKGEALNGALKTVASLDAPVGAPSGD